MRGHWIRLSLPAFLVLTVLGCGNGPPPQAPSSGAAANSPTRPQTLPSPDAGARPGEAGSPPESTLPTRLWTPAGTARGNPTRPPVRWTPTASGGVNPPISSVTGLAPTVTVQGTDTLEFVPARATVKAGGVVEWRNTGTAPHNVTFDNGVHSGTLNGGDTYEARFNTPGTYHYLCTFHAPAMAGTIVVIS
jgi:plastocyanin